MGYDIRISDPGLVRAYRRGELHIVTDKLGGDACPLTNRCAQCCDTIKASESMVLVQDAMGWQGAHVRCVGAPTDTQPVAESGTLPTINAPISIDYAKSKLPARQSIVARLQARDEALGMPGATLSSIIDARISRAQEGDLPAIREIVDRLDGKPAQTVDTRSVNVHLTAREMSEEELDEIIARGDNHGRAVTIDQ